MKKKLLLVAFGISLSLSACGGNPPAATNAPIATESSKESALAAPVESSKDFVGDSYTDTGDGIFLVVTAGGNSENGAVPVVYATPDTSLLQIGYETTDMNGGSLSYVYIDGTLSTKEQLSDSQGTLDLSDASLAVGIHKIEVVQYENDAPDKAVTCYKVASYEIKEK